MKSDRKMVIRKQPVFVIKRCYTFDEWLQIGMTKIKTNERIILSYKLMLELY